VQTPQPEFNRPGLSALAYRVGTWATFKESMKARLSSASYPALQNLKTRDDDDFTIAFLDATAIVLDILSFYQERLANESYLRTATQLRSLTELSRLIGYQPKPGVSAATYVAFSLRQAPGQPPDPTASPITIPQGTQVQSVPAQGQTPQTFETAADIQAKPDWNALQVQTGLPWGAASSDTPLYLAGAATQLQPGDFFLVIGSPTALSWYIGVIATVTIDGQNNRTLVTWSEEIGSGSLQSAQNVPEFYAFRQRAALFGYNALQPFLLDQKHNPLPVGLLAGTGDWNFLPPGQSDPFFPQNLVDLDGVYSKMFPGGWIALIVPRLVRSRRSRRPFYTLTVTLYNVNSIATISRSDFGVSAKISRLTTDTTTNLATYYAATRDTSALVQSEQLAVAEQPLNYPLYGSVVDLEGLRSDLAGIAAVAITGKRQKLTVADGITLSFQPGDGTQRMTLNPGDILTLSDPALTPLPLNPDGSIVTAAWGPSGAGPQTLYVEDAGGRPGTVDAFLSNFNLLPSGAQDPQVSEYALVSSVNASPTPYPHTRFQLQGNLSNCYDRTATTVNANVGLATAGQSVSEIMGSGNASTPDQGFTLRQSPLTYVQATTPSGMQSTLQARVNGVAWSEVPSLYQQPPAAQVFATLNQSDSTTDVLFGGDGEGALLPTGQNNVQANYRIGSGSAGNVGAGTITTLLDRPLGVCGVFNPQSATGGQDPQSIEDIRVNAPQTVLTLGRAVSIVDYQNYASSFAGIAKAYAIWIPNGPGRGVFLTVAGVNGAALPNNGLTIINLVRSLRSYGNPLVPILVRSYVETLFSFAAAVQYNPSYDQPTVQAQVQNTLTGTFSFAARSFGQAVSVDEISAVIQGVAGVVAVNVTGLRTTSSSTGGDLSASGVSTISKLIRWNAQAISLRHPFVKPTNLLCAYLPVASAETIPQPAEILVIDPTPGAVTLRVMS